MLETVERSKIRDVVARRLKSLILADNLRPGDRLPTEAELAARFGVSRLSLREATKSLEFLGIVESKPGRGLTVGRVNMDRVTEYLGFHPALQDVAPDELIDTRIIVETGILPQVARRMKGDPTIYDKLNEINFALSHARTIERWVELDVAFHRSLLAASGLSPILAFGDMLDVFFQRFRESVGKGEWARGIQSHQQILDGLKAGRVREADRILRTHIDSHRARLEAAS